MGRLSELFSNLPTHFSVKATLLKIVEIKYSKDGLDFRAALKNGPIKATVDQEGNVNFTGNIGSLVLQGDPVLKALGSRFKFLSVIYSLADNGDIKYAVTISVVNAASFTIEDQFDIEKLILERGLLKKAYDPIKNRGQQLEDAINAGT